MEMEAPYHITTEEFIESQRIRYKYSRRPNKSKMVIHVTLYYECNHVLQFDFDHLQYQRHTVPYFDYKYFCSECQRDVAVKKYTVRRIK